MPQEKKTAEAVKREVAQLKERIEVLKEMAREQGLAFSSLDEDQLTKKVQGKTSKSPFIYSESWTGYTSPGSVAHYTVHVRNPDPTGYYPVYATIFFGLGNFFGVDQAWIGRDKRWPEFSSGRTFLPAGSDHSFFFKYLVPTGLPLGAYNGNTVVWRGNWYDVGIAFDRASFDVHIS